MIKICLLTAALTLSATTVYAQSPTCSSVADCAQKAMEAAYQAKLALQIATPKRTIIAWSPTSTDYSRPHADGSRTIIPPKGWVVCDGENNTPDLTTSFIMGTTTFSEVGAVGGSAEHSHTGRTGLGLRRASAPNDDHHEGGDHVHDFTTNNSPHLPPHVKLVYLMKI